MCVSVCVSVCVCVIHPPECSAFGANTPEFQRAEILASCKLLRTKLRFSPV